MSVERDVSRERGHHRDHSTSEAGRLSVPMWDSADPDRCPPPLPIPPGSTSLQTKSNASANIQATANKLSERARESLGASYMTNASPGSSPEKSLIKGAAHRRMQSAHVAGGKDLKSYLENMRSGSPERSTTAASSDFYSSSSSRPGTPTRQTLKPILGENTPPSATMRALQSMSVKDDSALDDITNGRSSIATADVTLQLDKLTSIATNLQQEMSSLTRRSKDNAADLMGLKEAAKSRDDEIRKQLKDLVTSPTVGGASPRLGQSRVFGLGLLESKPYGSPSPLPRAASHNSFLDADHIGSPSPFSVEGAASVAMLEKIIREMVTKEGQERLLSNLSELMDKSSKLSTEAVAKVTELSQFIKDNDKQQSLMRAAEPSANNALIRAAAGDAAVPADLKVLLGKIKESVAGQGGMTAEVKALIRELRGEILGMGRELGRKLDQAEATNDTALLPEQSTEQIQKIVNQSVVELRDHMENLIQESSQQSSALVQSKSETSSEDMYAMVKHALAEHGDALVQSRGQPDFDKEDILAAVRTACDNFKPEIELQQYGLEREEILEVLKEGLAEHNPSKDSSPGSVFNRQEIFYAISEAVKAIEFPAPALDTHAIKADLLASVRECLVEHADSNSRVMEISRDDLFDAVKAGLDGSSIPSGGFGEQVLQQLHELVDGMRVEFKQYSAANGRETEHVLDAVKDGLEALRGQIEVYVDRAQDVTGKDEIIETVRCGLEDLREDIRNGSTVGSRSEGGSRGFGDSEVGAGSLDSIRDEIAHLRDTLAPLLITIGAGNDKDDMLATIREAIAQLPSAPGSGISTDMLEAIHGEFEKLQSSIRLGGGRGETEEMFDSVRLGLDDLRSHIDKKLENPERHILSGEILDTLNEGLDGLRADFSKSLEKPLGSHEVLDTLKEGLAGLRTDMVKLHSGRGRAASTKDGQIVLADAETDGDAADDGRSSTSLKRNDLEKMEVLLAQLQIKVEAMDRNIQDIPASSASAAGDTSKQFSGFDDVLKEIQVTVADLAARDQNEAGDAATKTDTDAIETLLRNTKSQMEADTLANREQVDAIEAVARVAKDAVDALTAKVDENIATKADVAAVETLATDVKEALEALKEQTQDIADGDDEKATKTDIGVLGVIVTEIKDKMSEMVLPDVETLPDKADIEQLNGLINDLREGHERFRETYDKDIEVTAKAFDDRRKDTEDIVTSVTAIKELLDEVKQDVADNHDSHATSFEGLDEALNTLQEKVAEHPAMAEDVKAILESVKTEFEKAHASLGTLQTGQSAGMDKHAEHKEAIITALSEKIDARTDDLTKKHDELQKTAEEKAAAQDAVLAGTKDLADELKISIDTLGTVITETTSGFTDATDKLGQDSKTVFNRVDDVYNKLDETQLGLSGEHQATRDEIAKAVDGVAGLRDDMLEHNPKVLVSLQELHALVALHHEHAQKTTGELSEALKGVNGAVADEVRSRLTENAGLLPAATAAGNEAIHEKLDRLMERDASPAAAADVHEKLDRISEHVSSGTVIEKLEQLAAESLSSAAQLERLDALQAQMAATAAEVSAFIAAQTQRIAAEHEAKEKEAEALALAVSRSQAQKEVLETDVAALMFQKTELRSAVTELSSERDGLLDEKARVTADVQALHAALAIRKEELAGMQDKADALERRIVEGLMNQSRVLFAATHQARAPRSMASGSQSRHKGRDLRIPSDASNAAPPSVSSGATSLAQSPSRIKSLQSNRLSTHRASTVGTQQQERRIMSLSQISNNAAAGRASPASSANALAMVPAPRPLENLKRAQTGLDGRRKSSWSGTGSSRRGFTPLGGIPDEDPDHDKENAGGAQAAGKAAVLYLAAPPSAVTPTEPESFIDVSDSESPSTPGAASRRTSAMTRSSAHTYSTLSRPGSSSSAASSRMTSSPTGTATASLSATLGARGGRGGGRASAGADSVVASLVADEVERRIAAGELDLSSDAETEDGRGRSRERDGAARGVQAVDYAAAATDRVLAAAAKGRGRTPADSGLGSELPTAQLGSGFGGYFPAAAPVGTE